MSVIFLESFDNYLTMPTAVLGKWQSIQNANNALSIVAGQGRNGTDALQVSMAGVSPPAGNYLQGGFTATTRSIIGIAMKVNSFDPANGWSFVTFMDGGTNQVTLGMDTTGRIALQRGAAGGTQLAISTNPVIAATGVSYYLELDCTFNNGAGAFTLRSNGVAVTGMNGIVAQNTAPSGNNRTNGLRLGVIGNNSVNFAMGSIGLFDDLYLIDQTVGAHNTAFLGDMRVFASFPIADGTTLNFTPSPNQAHYLNVNQVEQDGDTTYNYDANALDIDLYQHTPTPASTGTIFAVQLCQVSRKDDAAARSTSNYLKSVASTFQGAVVPLSQSYAWYLDVTDVDPATTNPFTKAAIDAAQIGVIVAA